MTKNRDTSCSTVADEKTETPAVSPKIMLLASTSTLVSTLPGLRFVVTCPGTQAPGNVGGKVGADSADGIPQEDADCGSRSIDLSIDPCPRGVSIPIHRDKPVVE